MRVQGRCHPVSVIPKRGLGKKIHNPMDVRMEADVMQVETSSRQPAFSVRWSGKAAGGCVQQILNAFPFIILSLSLEA